MTYQITKLCTTTDEHGEFQDIQRISSITIASDAFNPCDHDDFVIPQATPMAPVHSGAVHNHGIWLPVRRMLVTNVANATTFTVVDSNPFHVGDLLQGIDSTGPAAGGFNLGAILTITRATHVMTVAAVGALAAGDWVEVQENGIIFPVITGMYLNPCNAGLLRYPEDSRQAADSTTGIVHPGTIVVEGAIWERDINFPDDATDDRIMFPQLGAWNELGHIAIIPLNKGEVVRVPDWSDLS